MNKQEFMQKLEEALSGMVDGATLRNQLEFYHEYFLEETRKGRSEMEIADELGDPWAIAKNLEKNTAYYTGGPGERQNTSRSDIQEEAGMGGTSGKSFVYHTNSSFGCWIFAILFLLIVLGVLSLFVGVVKVLAPVLFPVLIIVLVIKLFQNR